MAVLVWLMLTLGVARAALPCIRTATGAVTVHNASACPVGSHLFQHAGVNIYDVLWDAWQPTGSQGNSSTSIQALLDASAYGLRLIRCFARPWSYTAENTWLMMSSAEKQVTHPILTR